MIEAVLKNPMFNPILEQLLKIYPCRWISDMSSFEACYMFLVCKQLRLLNWRESELIVRNEKEEWKHDETDTMALA